MSYDMETVLQAFAIAADESTDDIEALDDSQAFLYILDYCRRHMGTLLHDAAKELNERRTQSLLSGITPQL